MGFSHNIYAFSSTYKSSSLCVCKRSADCEGQSWVGEIGETRVAARQKAIPSSARTAGLAHCHQLASFVTLAKSSISFLIYRK